MRPLIGEISEDRTGYSESALGLENALARLVRRRWPSNTLENVMAEWELTRGQASGVVYAQASRSTINAVILHPRGGLSLLMTLGEVMTGETVEGLLIRQIEAATREAQDANAKRDRLQALVSGSHIGVTGKKVCA